MKRDATKRLILTAAASAVGSLLLAGCISTSLMPTQPVRCICIHPAA